MSIRAQRDTLFLEDAEVESHEAHPGAQYVLRVRAPECALRARPGTFAHIQCDPQLPMRRPISIMRVSAQAGWVDFLYKAVGSGTRLLAKSKVGETVSVLGPIGRPFQVHPERTRLLLVGGGVGMPPMIFLAESLRRDPSYRPLVLLGSEAPFPFPLRPSQILLRGLPDGVIAGMPLLDDWNIPSRLASLRGYPGCHQGLVTDLAQSWLSSLEPKDHSSVEIFACGPHPMLQAVAAMASELGLPCQVSLEEFMACAVGGCAGCVVEVATAQGPAMQRVCVDGPVFDAHQVFPSAS
jgi:dihydroorotate dehydrogenase electron transfer subunit